jgi:hypothetical protein
MRLSWLVLACSLFGGLVAATPARSQDAQPAESAESRPVLLTVDPGFCAVVNGHFTNIGQIPLVEHYLGVTFQLDLRGPLAANVFVGLGGCFAITAGGTARLAGQWHDHLRVTAGVGPTYAVGGAVLAEGDVALEIRSRPGFALVLGPRLGVALSSGADVISSCSGSCNGGVPAGTYFVLFRLGLGFNL